MSFKFDLTYNTPTDWVKAATAGVVAGLTYLAGALPDGLTGPEYVGIASAAVAAFGAVLGLYSTNKKDGVEPDPNPYTPAANVQAGVDYVNARYGEVRLAEPEPEAAWEAEGGAVAQETEHVDGEVEGGPQS